MTHSALDVFALTYERRHLLAELVRREISERHAGNMLGAVWAIISPLVLIAVYLFIFTVVFKVRIQQSFEMPLDYSAYILSGLIPWLAMQELLGKAPGLISSQANLVKQIVFPIELLPIRSALSAFVPMIVGLMALFVYVLATTGWLQWTYLLLPVVMVLQAFVMIGMAYLLSSFGVFVRDLKDLIPNLMLIVIYLLPVFYLPAWVPALFKPILYLNPFSYLIWCYQDVLYYGRIEHPQAWLVLTLFAIGSFLLGVRLFNRLKTSFSTAL